MDRSTRPAPFSMLRASLTLTLVAGGSLVMVLGTLSLAVDGRFAAEAVAGASLSLIIAVLAQIPVWLASRRDDPNLALLGALAGLVARLGLTAGGIVVLALATPLDPLALAVAMLGWYLLLLFVEITLVHRFLARAGSTSTSSGEEVAA